VKRLDKFERDTLKAYERGALKSNAQLRRVYIDFGANFRFTEQVSTLRTRLRVNDQPTNSTVSLIVDSFPLIGGRLGWGLRLGNRPEVDRTPTSILPLEGGGSGFY
jgi:hypothetical protein